MSLRFNVTPPLEAGTKPMGFPPWSRGPLLHRGEKRQLSPLVEHGGFKPRVRYNLIVSDWGRWRLPPLNSCYLGLRGLPSLHGPPGATLIRLAWLSSGHEVSSRGQWAATIGAPPDPAPRVLIPQIGACTNLNVHVPMAFNLAPL